MAITTTTTSMDQTSSVAQTSSVTTNANMVSIIKITTVTVPQIQQTPLRLLLIAIATSGFLLLRLGPEGHSGQD